MASRFVVPYAVLSVLWLATYVALLLIALIVVRPRRQLAGGLMAGAAGVWILGLVANQVGPQLLARMISGVYMDLIGWYHLGVGVWSTGGWVVFILALLDLARAVPQRSDAAPFPTPAGGDPRP